MFTAIRRHLTAVLITSILFTMHANSQQPIKNYDAAWKKVTAFTEKELPKSALAEVKKISELAKKEKQEAQVIKALVAMTQLQTEIQENNDSASIATFEKELAGSTGVAASILQSQLATMYWSYFQQNRWKFYDRTKTDKFVKTDIATWDAEDFHKRISTLFLQSVANQQLLVQTRIENFDAIINKGNMRHLRPTLFDLLAHRALSYFKNDETDIAKPAYAFEINQATAFDPAAAFAKQKFTTRDSLSLKHKALLLYQQLIALHLGDAKPDALLDVDIDRISFVKEHSTLTNKEELYVAALTQLTTRYGNLPAAAQAWYLLAAFHNQQADTYKPFGDSAYRYSRVIAKEICERLLAQKDSSEGKTNAYNLLNSIRSKSFEFTVEKVNVPGLPFRSLVKYRNIANLSWRILKADDNLKAALERTYEEQAWKTLTAAAAEKKWNQPLPATNDFQQHSTEVKIPELPIGEYILLASSDPSFSGKGTVLGARLVYVSAISYINSGYDYFVLHRDNGSPLQNASVQVWRQNYDYNTSRYIKAREKKYSTDANGYFRMDRPDIDKRGNGNLLLEITQGSDRLFMNDAVYDYYYYYSDNGEEKKQTSVFLFTDRAIYRPAQTLYFKAIVLSHHAGKKTGEVMANFKTTVLLRNTAGEEVDSLVLTTNEYGSVNGKFTLPATGNTGEFSLYIREGGGTSSFRVEEYKRPKFFVEYEPIKGTYTVNDTIAVTGIAKAYAGNNIDGAQVKYRVVRQPRFIYSWLFWRWWQPPVQEMEIAHGELKTDKDGKFIVKFTAIPDKSIDRKFEPVFDYTVYADITDLNGETRSGEQMVSVSYKSLLLVTNIPATIPADSLKKLYIRTENTNGEYEPARVTVSIAKQTPEQRLIRDRLWERPDQFTLGKQEYISLFPHDEYDNETDPRNWPAGAPPYNQTDSARENGEWKFGSTRFTPGFYVITMETRDRRGEIVKDIRYVELTDPSAKQLAAPAYRWAGESKTMAEPGEQLSVEWGTAADNLYVIQQVSKSSNAHWPFTNGVYSFVQLNNEKKTFSFPVAEEDRGGFGVGWFFVKHNRFYQDSRSLSVPWTNKTLKIEYATYRDKTLPGAEEKWKLKISGYKSEKFTAELLASMYDASLDAFVPHYWYAPSIWPSFYGNLNWNGGQSFATVESSQRAAESQEYKSLDKRYDNLLNDEGGFGNRTYYSLVVRGMNKYAVGGAAPPAPAAAMEEARADGYAVDRTAVADTTSIAFKDGDLKQQGNQPNGKTGNDGTVQIRKNFNETAFFLPDLHTDAEGNIEFSFTMPEALTKWKFQALAHTKQAAFGYSTMDIVTQKDLMVQPFAPRFLREGDKMEFSAKIVNLTGKELTGIAELQLFDAATNEPVDGAFHSMSPKQYFTVAAGQSEKVEFPIEVPYQFDKALQWRIVAKAGDFSDGEENAMPVLTNRMLVTESMPLPMRGTGTKTFSFDKLINSGSSETLTHQALTIEYTTNPAWYAVQALPYLMEYPYECAEQTWNRYYANTLAAYIAGSSPRIRQVFERWKNTDKAALLSNLQKNQELKAVLLEETPWVLAGKSEAEQKKNIGLLFDMVRMSKEQNTSFEKLKQMQSSNGGFVWFTGGPDDRYITQYILTGIGHLRKLGALDAKQELNMMGILQTAIPYLDRKIKEDYDNLIKYKVKLSQDNLDYYSIQYLYMRSFFPNVKVAAASQTAYNYYFKQAQQYWTGKSKYMQGMITLALHRAKDLKTPAAVLRALKETSISNEELGMYWKNLSNGWYWYEAPIETQALLIEAFQEAGKDTVAVNDLRTWLLKNKQTNNWKTTKATAEACYALLLKGNNWLTEEPVVEVKLGTTVFRSTDQQQEAGTGYFKQTIAGNNVRPSMGNVTVNVSTPQGTATSVPTWGAVYWQYFEDLDKITMAKTPLQLSKKLFVERTTDRGPVITPVNDGDAIKVGDKIKVRVELRVDRDMEYVHMKDMRAAALEPVNVLSQYKWQGGLGYYESTRDASTNFFFSALRKGTYVFEYTLFATHAGNFSNGITTIQCMYAPEFTAHSEGIRINVE